MKILTFKAMLLPCLAAGAGALVTGSLLFAQTSGPATEYIYLGSRPVATENSNSSSGTGGGGQVQDFAVWPPSASLGAGQSQTFTAVFSGTGAAVTWSISPAGMGQITGANGNSAIYTAPSSVTSTQAVTITAAAAGSPAMSASAEIRFYAPQSLTGDYPLSGSFLNFYRSMPQSLWAREFDWMRQIDMNTIVIGSVGGLRPDSSDPAGYSLSAEGLLYPSTLIDPADRPATDLLEMVLSLADARNINVYVGSLATYSDWTDGTEFGALRKYNKLVAQEILSTYGHHSSLKGWYFSQEIWMNWVMYYVNQSGSYYGTTLLANFVSDMKSIDAAKPVVAAVVFKETGYGAMPGMSPGNVQAVTTAFLNATGLQVLAPQDGQGAGAGAPPIGDLPSYYQAFSNAAAAANPPAALWSTVETFVDNGNPDPEQYPPASAVRIQNQASYERPYVTGYISYIFGDDLSQQATFYPVEASELNREYQNVFRPGAVPDISAIVLASYQSSPAPSSYYPDPNSHLKDRTGGGYDNYSLTDWSGYRVEDDGVKVIITADLGSVFPISAVRALSMSMTGAGIYHPQRLAVETSSDGQNFTVLGNAATPGPDTAASLSAGRSSMQPQRRATFAITSRTSNGCSFRSWRFWAIRAWA